MAKQSRSRRTHEQILESAAAEFARHGYQDANLQRVADRIGVTKGAVYGHFDSKEGLASALVERLGEVLQSATDGPGAQDAPALEELRRFTSALAERIESDVRINAALRLAVDRAQAEAEPPGFLADIRRRALEVLDSDWPPDGRTPSLPSGPLADLAVAMLVGAYYTAPSTDRHGLSARVRDMWEVLVPALARDVAR